MRQRTDVGVARIGRCAQARQDEEGGEVALIEHVHVCIGGEVAPATEIAIGVVIYQLPARVPAVLHQLILGGRGHVCAAGLERLVSLVEGLRAEECRLEHELRDVRPLHVTVARHELPAKQILPCDRIGKLIIRGASEERQIVHVGHSLTNQRIGRVLSEWHVREQRRPVVLNLFGRRLRAGDARRGRDDGGVRVETF